MWEVMRKNGGDRAVVKTRWHHNAKFFWFRTGLGLLSVPGSPHRLDPKNPKAW